MYLNPRLKRVIPVTYSHFSLPGKFCFRSSDESAVGKTCLENRWLDLWRAYWRDTPGRLACASPVWQGWGTAVVTSNSCLDMMISLRNCWEMPGGIKLPVDTAREFLFMKILLLASGTTRSKYPCGELPGDLGSPISIGENAACKDRYKGHLLLYYFKSIKKWKQTKCASFGPGYYIMFIKQKEELRHELCYMCCYPSPKLVNWERPGTECTFTLLYNLCWKMTYRPF